MRIATAFLACTCAFSIADAQSVDLRVLIPRSANFWANSLPSLHNGVYAGLGVRISDFRNVLYGGRLSDPSVPPGGVPHNIVETGETIPSRPDRVFGSFGIPTVWNEQVYFTGAVPLTNLPDGVFARDVDGGPIAVIADRFNGLAPWIARPFAGAEGLVYVNPGISAGTGAGISLYTYDQQWIPIGTYFQSMPDGSVLQSTSISRVGIGGGKVVYSVRVDTASGTGSGVYLYDIETGHTSLVVNSNTLIPGDGRQMEILGPVDTDGSQVAFGAGNGHLYFGGIATVCVANADGSDVRVVARTGDSYPGVQGRTFLNVGNPAVDQGFVYFQGTYLDGTIERIGLFVHAGGVTLPIVVPTQSVGGASGHFAWYDPSGVSGADVVMELERPTASMGVSEYTLVHAHVNVPTPCPADFNADGTVDFFDYLDFVDVFASGVNTADFNNDGVVDFFDYLDFVDAFSVGC